MTMTVLYYVVRLWVRGRERRHGHRPRSPRWTTQASPPQPPRRGGEGVLGETLTVAGRRQVARSSPGHPIGSGCNTPHTVTSDRGIWASDALDTGTQFARVFTKAGTFPLPL
jgi:hypothetical protein